MPRSIIEPATGVYTQVAGFPNYFPYAPVDKTFSYVAKSWTRDDIRKNVMVDGWRKPSSYFSHEIVTNPPEGDYTIEQKRDQPWWFKRHDHGFFTPAGVGILPVLPAYDGNVHNSLYYSAVKQVKDQVLNVGVALAEVGETISLIEGRGKQVVTAFLAAKRRNWPLLLKTLNIGKHDWKRPATDVSGRWLEVVFGWLPLLEDIHGAIDEIGRKNLETGFTLVARSSKRSNLVEQVKLTAPVNIMGSNQQAPNSTWHGIASFQETYKTALWFDVDCPQLKRAAQLGLTNPAEILWEIVPFSFVVDWFIPIGDWLASLDTSFGVTFKGGTNTWFSHRSMEIEKVFSSSGSPFSSVGEFIVVGGPGLFSRTSSTRTVLEKSPPPLYIKNPFSTWKAITSLALLPKGKR